MIQDFNVLKTEFNVLEYVVNYKNSDYTPEFFKNKLKSSEENFYKIAINCIFEINNNFVFNLNKLKEFLKNVTLVDNEKEYDIFLESTNDIEIGEDTLIIITFNCNGRIFKKRKKKTMINNEKLTVDSVRDIRLNFSTDKKVGTNDLKKVVLNNMSFSFNTKEGFKINSEEGKVENLEDWDFYEFPKTKNKEFVLKLSGIDEIIVDYREEL